MGCIDRGLRCDGALPGGLGCNAGPTLLLAQLEADE